MPLGPGTVLGANVVLEREIGRGAMGEVWLAHNRALGSPVAVKVLHAAMAGDAEAERRFAQEARGAAQLDSPHVVKIFDYGITDDHEPYIVMELLRGRDLREHLETVGALAPRVAANLLRQLCRGLAQAHERGLIHRDIKPANVFLLDPDGEPFVKVLDFGVAKYAGQGDLGMTSTGALMGTPYYMSPEQFIDPRAIDHRSDLWSAAVVAYAALLAKLPFLGTTVGALSLAVHRGEFTPPTQLAPHLPPAFDAFFARAFQPAPAHRFASARELADAFDAAAASHSPSAQVHHATLAPEVAASQAAAIPPASTQPAASWHHSPSHGQPHYAPHEHLSASHPQSQPQSHPQPQSPAGSYPTHPSAFTPQLDGTAPPATYAPPKRSGGLWLGALLATFGLGALATAFVVPRLTATDRSSAGRASEDEEPRRDDEEPRRDDEERAEGDGAGDEAEPSDTAAPTSTRRLPPPQPPPAKPATKSDDETPATIPDATGFSGKIASCWTQNAAAHDGYGGKPSSASVAFRMGAGALPNAVSVQGPASSYGGFKSCVIRLGVAHAQARFGSREANKTVVTGAQLSACVWDQVARRHTCGP